MPKSPSKRPIKPHDPEDGRYRVRDRAGADGVATVWSPPEGLTKAEAVRLRDHLAATKKSSTVRIELIPAAPDPTDAAVGPPTPAPDFSALSDAQAATLCGDDAQQWTVALVSRVALAFVEMGAASIPTGSPEAMYDQLIEKLGPFVGLMVETVVDVRKRASIIEAPAATDGELEAMRQAALAAAKPVAQAAQARHDRRKATVVVQPPHKPPPSPLSGETMEEMPDHEPPEEEQLADEDVHDLLGGVGGAPGKEDARRAAQTAEQEQHAALAKAESTYRASTSKLAGVALPWSQMGKLARSQWIYFVTQGGPQPGITMIVAHEASLKKAQAAYEHAVAEGNHADAQAWASMDIDAREEWIFFVTHPGNVPPAIISGAP